MAVQPEAATRLMSMGDPITTMELLTLDKGACVQKGLYAKIGKGLLVRVLSTEKNQLAERDRMAENRLVKRAPCSAKAIEKPAMWAKRQHVQPYKTVFAIG